MLIGSYSSIKKINIGNIKSLVAINTSISPKLSNFSYKYNQPLHLLGSKGRIKETNSPFIISYFDIFNS